MASCRLLYCYCGHFPGYSSYRVEFSPHFFGADQKLAQVVGFATLAATVALVVTFLTLDLNLAFLEGIPFFLSYSLVVFSPLFIPALLVVGLILVIELTFTRLADPIARRWHVAALACCVAWAVTWLSFWR